MRLYLKFWNKCALDPTERSMFSELKNGPPEKGQSELLSRQPEEDAVSQTRGIDHDRGAMQHSTRPAPGKVRS